VFASAYFHFSHYAKANDSTPMGDSYAWANWLGGTAVLCQLTCNQEVSDQVPFPIEANSRSMSVDLNQDKTGQSADPSNVDIQHAEALGVFLHGNKLPYIAAVHCCAAYALTEDEGINYD
jgi:hypothetical protein